MLSGLERFFGQHEHTVAALEAVSTFTAVVLSLALARYAQRVNRTRVRAYVDIRRITHSSLAGLPNPRYVTVSITNDGVLPATIPMSFFYWRVPFAREATWVVPWDYVQHDEWVPQKHYPIEIAPRKSETFFLADIPTFRKLRERPVSLKVLARWRQGFIRAYVVTDDGRQFRVRLGASLRKELRSIFDGPPQPA